MQSNSPIWLPSMGKPNPDLNPKVNWEHPMNYMLMGWWLFNDTRRYGFAAKDYTGRGNNGNFITFGGLRRHGLMGACYYADDDARAIDAGSGADLNLGAASQDFTVIAWVRMLALPSAGNDASFIMRASGDSNWEYLCGIVNVGGDTHMEFQSWKGAANPYVRGGSNLAVEIWYHMAWVRDCAANKYLVYLNAVADGNADGNSADLSVATNTRILCGGINYVVNPLSEIADLEVWKRALSAAEIYEHYFHPWGTAANPRFVVVPTFPRFIVVAVRGDFWPTLQRFMG